MATRDALGAFRAATRPRAVDVRLAGRTYRVAARPAADWMALIAGAAPLPLLDFLDGQGGGQVMLDLMTGRLTVDEIEDVTRRTLAAVSGMVWWEADRLIRGAVAQWRTIGGELTRLGVDPTERSLAAVLNAIYVIAVRTMTQEERNTFDAELMVPPQDASDQDRRAVQAASVAGLVAAFGPPPSM